MNNLIVQNKQRLAAVVSQNTELLTPLTQDQQQEFKENFYGLAVQEYLMKSIDPKEILQVAINATVLGLSVNPVHGECYILPFKGKAAIVPQLAGMQQTAFDAGFFLTVDNVWNVQGIVKRESEMNYSALAEVNIADNKIVDNSFVGWVVVLQDTHKQIETQEKFISIQYAITVNKGDLGENKASKLMHKAVRKAIKTMFIPRNRKTKMEAITRYDDTEIETITEPTPSNTQATQIDPLETTTEAEAPTQPVITIQDITRFFNTHKEGNMDKFKEVFGKYPNWKEANTSTLSLLLKDMNNVISN